MTVNVLGKLCVIRFNASCKAQGLRLLEACKVRGEEVGRFKHHLKYSRQAYILCGAPVHSSVLVITAYSMGLLTQAYPIDFPIIDFSTGEKLCLV